MADSPFKFSRKHLLAYLATALDPLIIYCYNPILPFLKTAFNVDIAAIALSVTFHTLPFSILCLISGTLSDRYSRPRILILGLLISSLGSFIGIFSPNILVFYLSRAVQGVGSAFLVPVSMALVGDITHEKSIGKAMGIYQVFPGIVSTLGPLIGPFLAAVNWRLVPLFLAMCALAIAAPIRNVFKITSRNSETNDSAKTLGKFRQVAGNRNVLLLALVGFSLFFTLQGVQPFISDFLSLPPLSAKEEMIGLAFSIAGLTGISCSLLTGAMIDRIGDKKTMTLGFLLMFVPQSLLIFTGEYWPYVALLSALQGFQTFALISAQCLLVKSASEARGSASSIFNFARFFGFALAPSILSTIYLTAGINSLYTLNLALFCVGILMVVSMRT